MGTPMDNGYKMVAERHLAFTGDHPNGSVANQVQNFVYNPESQRGFVTVNSQVWKDKADRDAGKAPDGEGNASMQIPGSTAFTKGSEVENTETSALGRALAMIGYHAKDTLASGDEIAAKKGEAKAEATTEAKPTDPATQKQKNKMFAMAKDVDIDLSTDEGKKVLAAIVLEASGKKSSKQLTSGDMDGIYKMLEDKREADALLASAVEAAGGDLVEAEEVAA